MEKEDVDDVEEEEKEEAEEMSASVEPELTYDVQLDKLCQEVSSIQNHARN